MSTCRSVRVLTAGCGALAALIATPSAAAAASTPADVKHDVVLVQYFDGEDDPCGLGAIEETMVDTVQVRRVAVGDGTFHLVDIETGRIYEDWAVDGTIDRTFRRTETFNVHVTRGGVLVFTQVFRQSDGDATFLERVHVTEVKGVVRTDRSAVAFPDCP